MEKRNISIDLDTARAWYQKGGELKEIALQAFTASELVPKVESWEEFCKKSQGLIAYHLDPLGGIATTQLGDLPEANYNSYPTKGCAVAMKAFQKLLFLYYDWNCLRGDYYISVCDDEVITVQESKGYEYHVFNFANSSEAANFVCAFRDLLIKARAVLG